MSEEEKKNFSINQDACKNSLQGSKKIESEVESLEKEMHMEVESNKEAKSDMKQLDVLKWSPSEVQAWINETGTFSKFVNHFEYTTGRELLDLNLDQLKAMGIPDSAVGPLQARIIRELKPKKLDENISQKEVRPLASATHLSLSDFLPSKSLPKVEPPAKPKRFIREEWLTSQIEIIMKNFTKKDGETVSDRIPPMALVGHSGSGKTRALKELSKAIQTNYDNLSVIYITFNSNTDLRLKESSRPLDSLLSRFAFAIADPNVIQGRPFHDINSNLQFVTTSNEIVNWLGDKPCILCIDELNNLIPSQRLDEPDMREVAYFLKDVFLAPVNRYFIFTSHVKATTLNLTYYMSSVSDRSVFVADFPIFQSTSEVNEILKDRSPVHPMIYGNSPGLAYVALKTPTYPSTRVQQCLKSLATTPSAPEIIHNLFSGDCSSLSEFDTITRISSNCRVWIPAFLKELFKSNELSNLENKYQIQAENVLDSLGRAKLNSGEAWEVVVFCTLFFRILDCLLTTQPTNPIQIPYYDWIPSLPSNFSMNVQYPTEDLGSVITKLSKPGSSPSVTLSYPKQSAFPRYDILIAVTYSSTEPVTIWGYQCKAGDLPNDPPNPYLSASIVLRSHDMDANSRSSAVNLGWKVAGMNERDALLGPTFAPLRLMEKPGGSVNLEADTNTIKHANPSKKRTGDPLIDDSTTKKQDTKK